MGKYHDTLVTNHKFIPDGVHKTHRIVVMEVMGKVLKPGHQVHHVNEDKRDYTNSNLVVCEDQSYHKLLHRRKNALIATGNKYTRQCTHCKRWENPGDLYISPNDMLVYHKECQNKYVKARRKRIKEPKIG